MSRRVVRNPEILWRDEPAEREAIVESVERGEDVSDRGWVILVEGGTMHQLNLVAGHIWCLADGTRDVSELARDLAEQFDAPAEEIREDVDSFVADCLARGWLRLEAA